MSEWSKKTLQQRLALLPEYAAYDFNPVIESALSWNIKDRSASTGFWIPRSEYKPRNARLHDRSGTHRARLQRDIERRLGEPPCPQPFGSFSDHDHFRMRCRILRNLPVVVSGRDDFVVVHEDCADRDFSYVRGKSSLLESQLHVVRII